MKSGTNKTASWRPSSLQKYSLMTVFVSAVNICLSVQESALQACKWTWFAPSTLARKGYLCGHSEKIACLLIIINNILTEKLMFLFCSKSLLSTSRPINVFKTSENLRQDLCCSTKYKSASSSNLTSKRYCGSNFILCCLNLHHPFFQDTANPTTAIEPQGVSLLRNTVNNINTTLSAQNLWFF